jgi:hypothetical protein
MPDISKNMSFAPFGGVKILAKWWDLPPTVG